MKKGLFFVGPLLLAFTVGAATGTKITAELQNKVVSYNGNLSNQQVISYKGNTYLSLKGYSSLANTAVNIKDGIIYFGSSNTSSGSSQTQAYGIKNPAPIGVTQKISVNNYSDKYTAEVTVKEVIRGEEALNMLKEENQYNDDPSDNEEYILAKIYVKAINVADGKSINLSNYDFDAYSQSNSKYEYVGVANPQPELNSTLYSGGSAEGWVTFKVKKSDVSPKVVYEVKYDGTGGIWFSLK